MKADTKKKILGEDTLSSLLEQLTFKINSMGIWSTHEDCKFDFTSNDIEIIFYTHGGSDTTVSNKVYTCSKHDMMILEPYGLYTSNNQHHDYYECVYMHFSVEPAYLQTRFLTLLLNDQVIFTVRDEAKIIFLIQEMVKENELKDIGYQSQLNAYLKSLCIDLIRKKHIHKSKDRLIANQQQVTIVNEVSRYINEHLSEAMLLDDIANLFQISPNYLFKSFKNVLGISPSIYMSTSKINKAKELLLKKELSVEEIAERCGYSSLYYFSSAFKNVVKCSPKKYQQIALEHEISQSQFKR